VKKLLLLAVLTLLPAAGASAEDKPPVGPQVESQVEPEDKPASCEDALGVSRVAEVDTKGGALFGDQYPPTTLLQKGEVVLTFDDGPHPTYTKQILAALAAQCTKATFFNVGEMVKQFPDIAKQVQAEGHTVGTHTWSHRNLGSLSLDGAKSEIESTITAENAVLPNGVWRTKAPDKIVDNVLKGLIKTDRGIILFHDIHEQTVKALPTVLKELKSHGFKVVHLVPKSQVEVVALAEPPKAEATQGRRAYRHARHGKHRRYAQR
jgi:hypothetical protein